MRTPPLADSPVELFAPGTTVADGELVLGGCRAGEIARAVGTPVLVMDEAALRARARRYVEGFGARWPDSGVVWASKSLPCTAIYGTLAEEGLGIDVAGGGELVMALAAGVDPATIVVHGNAKTDAEIDLALDAGDGLIVIDNRDDLARLEARAPRGQRVLLRVRPDVVAATHEAMATGGATSKFGLPLEVAEAVITELRASRTLVLEGLHVHVGSQIAETEPFTRAVEAIGRLGEFSTYDLGGGLGARYTVASVVPSVEEYLDALTLAARANLPAGARLLIEPGRSIVAEAACTLYRVVTVKEGARGPIVAIDGGMGDNLEVSLYGQAFDATLANRVGRGGPVTLVGRHCESGDELIASVSMRDPRVGDLVAVPVTGAYCLTMANNYNGALRPPIVLVRDGHARVVLRREIYEDLVRRDVDEPVL